MTYTKELLEQHLADHLTYQKIGDLYGISGNAIRKACVRLKVSTPKRRKLNPKENFNRGTSRIDKFSDSDFTNIITTCKGWDKISKSLGYKKTIGSETRNKVLNRCLELDIKPDIFKKDPILLKTKGELFFSSKNWQSARSSIQKSARKVYLNNNKILKCAVCNYTNHVEIAHVKNVSDYDDTSSISEINSIDNLIGLCPNHHWEYDNIVKKQIANSEFESCFRNYFSTTNI